MKGLVCRASRDIIAREAVFGWSLLVGASEKVKRNVRIPRFYYVVLSSHCQQFALRDIITRRAGFALGPSRHNRKRGCVQFVYVPIYINKLYK